MAKLLSFIKPILGALIVIIILKITGTLATVSYVANATLLKSGIFNSQPGNQTHRAEPFDYNFKIQTLLGEEIDFNQFKGKVIFLNLWATWCGPCRVEMPGIQALYNDVNNEQIVFIMLSLDKDEDLPKIKNYIGKNSFTFPVYQPKGYLANQLQVPSIPTTYIINKEGNIVSKEVGTTNFNTKKFRKYLADLAR
ncbi:MAG: TlpA disulfide reductase family protein [Cyclobacteriaceae bacterium]